MEHMRIKLLLSFILILSTLSPILAQRGKPHTPPPGYETYRSSSLGISMVYGITAGVIFPVLDIKGGNIDISSNPGFKAGIMWGVDFGRVEIVPEVLYSTFNMDVRDGSQNVELHNSSIDMPLLVGVKVARAVKLHVGPTFSLMCNNRLTYEDGTEEDYGRIKSSVGYVAGVTYNVVKNFIIDFRYTGRFTDYGNEWPGGSPYDIWMYSLDLTAGFRF